MKLINYALKALLYSATISLLVVSCKKKKGQAHLYEKVKEHSKLPSYLKFPKELTPNTPWDVDRKLQAKLTKEGKFTQTQRLFEILSWQWFIALNWPYDKEGNPTPSISDKGKPEWFSWKESYEVFRPNGERPAPWGEFTFPSNFPHKKEYNLEKVLFRGNKFVDFANPDIEDEIDQAFTGPIWDQNGNITRYEIRINRKEFDYILKNELYNFNGQIAFSKEHGSVDFPEGDREKEGVIEIKVAWKILEPTDIASRYFVTDGYVISKDLKSYTKKKVGMVGMHISSKTKSAPQWIWTTYEHVDNLEVNELEEINGKPLKASYYDTNNPTAAINVFPDTAGVAKPKTQIQRVLPISGATKALNKQVQRLLRKAGSKLQYYQQVGTQWPTEPHLKPYTLSDSTYYKLPDAVINKAGGNSTPVYLTNMIMETYFQGGTFIKGNAFYINQQFVTTKGDTVKYEKKYDANVGNNTGAFNVYTGNEPAFFQINDFPYHTDTQNTQKIIFGTESCVGCHFSSGIATGSKLVKGKRQPVFGLPSSADFSWLLNQKPQFKSE